VENTSNHEISTAIAWAVGESHQGKKAKKNTKNKKKKNKKNI